MDLTCVILVGGLGKRLRPVVAHKPKSMVYIQGRPFLEYLLRQLRSAGFKDVVLCVGYKGEFIKNYFADGRKYGVHIRYSQEKKLLGTAGALAHARHLIHSNPFLVMNGDVYCQVDFKKMLKQHLLRQAQVTIATLWLKKCWRYGSVLLGPEDAIVRFTEKSKRREAGYINGGIYVFNQKILDLIPLAKPYSLERDVFTSLAGHNLYAFRTRGIFIDIGIPSGLRQARQMLKGPHYQR